MANHVGTRKSGVAVTRRLFLSYRDTVILAVCILGLMTAWLVYGASISAHSTAASAAGISAGSPLSQAGAPRAASTAPPAAGSSAAPSSPAAIPPVAAGAAAAAAPALQGPAASAPQRITYPAAGLDVVVHPLQPDGADADSRSIVPPETMDGYWLEPFGVPGAGSTNTTYVIGHSWEGLDAPFNHLSSKAAPGDELTVTTLTGVLRYRVDSVTTYTKSTLKDSPIWGVASNRLVLISCYTEDLWGRNVAVVASPVPGG
ncbi:class F sortase [Arthrobacter sp. 92]|uniref:class F sortase n=1 Tax=Arthrobacter sp. 92 TaxID=3418175 RepID=UPI003CFE6330